MLCWIVDFRKPDKPQFSTFFRAHWNMGFHFYLSMITIESDQPELGRALESLVEESECCG